MKNKLTVLLAMFAVGFAWYAVSGPVTITGVGPGSGTSGAGSDTTAVHVGVSNNMANGSIYDANLYSSRLWSPIIQWSSGNVWFQSNTNVFRGADGDVYFQIYGSDPQTEPWYGNNDTVSSARTNRIWGTFWVGGPISGGNLIVSGNADLTGSMNVGAIRGTTIGASGTVTASNGLTVVAGTVTLPPSSVAYGAINTNGAVAGQSLVWDDTAKVWTNGTATVGSTNGQTLAQTLGYGNAAPSSNLTVGTLISSNFMFAGQQSGYQYNSIVTNNPRPHALIERTNNTVAYVGGIFTAGRQISTNNRSIAGQYSTNMWEIGGNPSITTNTLAANTIYRNDLRTRFMVWMLRVVVRGAADGAGYLYARVYGYVYLYGYIYGQGFINYKAAWFNEGPNRAGWGRSNGITTTNDIMVTAVVPSQFNYWLTNRVSANGTGGSVAVLGTTSTSIP